MVKKRNPSRGRAKSTPASKRRVVRITSNPFLNFFLSVVKVKGNQKVEKIARDAAVEWRKMAYLDKTPYYLLADEAKKRKKRSSKRRHQGEYYADWDSPLMVVSKKRLRNDAKSDTELEESKKPKKIEKRRKTETVTRKESASSMESSHSITTDVEEFDSLLEAAQGGPKPKKLLQDNQSDSSLGLSTNESGGTFDIFPSDSSFDVEEDGNLKRSHDFYQ